MQERIAAGENYKPRGAANKELYEQAKAQMMEQQMPEENPLEQQPPPLLKAKPKSVPKPKKEAQQQKPNAEPSESASDIQTTIADGDPIMILNDDWLELVLSGAKTMELRGRRWNGRKMFLGRTVDKHIGAVHAAIDVENGFAFQSQAEFEEAQHEHMWNGTTMPYERTYGHRLSNLQVFENPIPFLRKLGQVGRATYTTVPTTSADTKEEATNADTKPTDNAEDTKSQICEKQVSEPQEPQAPEPLRNTSSPHHANNTNPPTTQAAEQAQTLVGPVPGNTPRQADLHSLLATAMTDALSKVGMVKPRALAPHLELKPIDFQPKENTERQERPIEEADEEMWHLDDYLHFCEHNKRVNIDNIHKKKTAMLRVLNLFHVSYITPRVSNADDKPSPWSIGFAVACYKQRMLTKAFGLPYTQPAYGWAREMFTAFKQFIEFAHGEALRNEFDKDAQDRPHDHTHTFTRTHAHTHTHAHTQTHTHPHTHAHAHTGTHTHTRKAQRNTSIHAHKHTPTH